MIDMHLANIVRQNPNIQLDSPSLEALHCRRSRTCHYQQLSPSWPTYWCATM